MRQRPAIDHLDAAPAEPVVVETKLHPPVLRSEHVSRPRLLAQLDSGRGRRLTLVDAPAGSGKSTLLADWCRTVTVADRVAWLSLDAQDNDPVLFWTYVLHAMRRVEPDRFAGCLAKLTAQGVGLTRLVLPQLLNELHTLHRPLTLVLDDYHMISDRECHESLAFVLRRLPLQLRLVIATRSDPPLQLASLRANGELCELRAKDLAFADEEVGALLNDALGLDLAASDLATVGNRTEGWAAGLYLAALSLRGRADRSAFITEFAGDNRHLVAYLGGEVLERLPRDQRDFLVQTSILDRLTGPLCDTVTAASGSTERLPAVEATNQFLIPLDQRGEWYRYHHLFQDLLQLELRRTQPELVPVLHGRAARWYQEAGLATAAIHHALAAQDHALAADVYFANAHELHQSGGLASLLRWIDAFPDETIAARPALAVAFAWVVGIASRSHDEFERWLRLAETTDYEGLFHNGMRSRLGTVALARAVFPFDDVGRSLTAAQTAVAEASDPRSRSYLQARMALGQCLYLAGRPVEARPILEEVLRAPLAPEQSAGVIRSLADLAHVSLELGELDRAHVFARRAIELCETSGLTAHIDSWHASLALSAVQAQYSRFDAAEAALATGVEPYLPVLRHWPIPYARALLELAPVRYARGHTTAARELLAAARSVIEGCADPGMLRGRLERIERQIQRLPRRTTGLAEELTDSELRVLRLLAGDLSQREIARELFVSVNTVKSHTRVIYAKLGINSRADAIRRAQELALLA